MREIETQLASPGEHLGVYAPETPLQRFNRYFQAVRADTPELVRRALRVRYHVYCMENGFENPEDHVGGLETDGYDAHSVHSLLLHRGRTVGTVRLILARPDAPERSFALQKLVAPEFRNGGSVFPLYSTAEVSRFCISKQLLRGAGIDANGERGSIHSEPFDPRNAPLMRLGLIQSLFRMSAQHGITHWCAAMEPQLLRMLAAMAIRFQPIGPPVEYHGLRQPCYCDVGAVLRAVRRERPSYWEILTDGGTIWNAFRVAGSA